MSDNEPFKRTAFANKPGIVGARWWQESMSIAHDPIARREALRNLLVVSAALAGVGVAGSIVFAASSSSPDARAEPRDSLTTQREYGWDFAARGEPLTFDGQSQAPFDRAALDRMAGDLQPTQPRLRPFYSPTLFQSPPATPKTIVTDDTSPFKPLRDVVMPVFTPKMDAAYRRGLALATLFDGVPSDRVVVVDLPGPEAVAFAAGAASRLEPVFTFDNWPHPRGVVPAHATLAAAAYYQPRFVKQAQARKGAPPALFVLDRSRLAPYTDEASQFDNRHVARLPSADNLAQLGVKHVLYVTPDGSQQVVELDDLNDDFVAFAAKGIDVKACAATDFGPDPSQASSPLPAGITPEDWPPYYYGSSPDTHYAFWVNYPWNPPQRPPKRQPTGVSSGYAYVPTPRATVFSGVGAGPAKSRPTNFGLVPVVIAAGTGIVLGAGYSRSGSLTRSTNWGGG